MIDHVTFGVVDFARSTAFYDRALAALGLRRLVNLSPAQSDGVAVAGYGSADAAFWLAEERATGGLLHIAFRAQTRKSVDAFHAAALRAGGSDNGAPGLRPQYHANYYAAYVTDPDGHNIEAVCHAAEG